MNPLSLLTKGQTFGGFKDRRGAYKLSTGYALPNFAGPKGPALAAPPAATRPLQTALFEPPPQAVAAAVLPKRAGAVPPAPKAMVQPPKEERWQESVWRRAARWGEEFFWWRKTGAKPGPSVQTELALEKVTVVRNDLSEEDLMVVPAACPAAPGKKIQDEPSMIGAGV